MDEAKKMMKATQLLQYKFWENIFLSLRFPPGHFYSPVPDHRQLRQYVHSVNRAIHEIPGIELRKNEQLAVLESFKKDYLNLPFCDNQNSDTRYYFNQGMFCYADAIFLYCFLCKHRPRRIIEIGSGYSSAVMLDTVDSFESDTDITFIEPFPQRLYKLLRVGDSERFEIIEKPVQSLPVDVFDSLDSGDLLFIDSSHVLKAGSDLQYLFFEILPRLSTGVFVHFHDVFFPFEYPSEWLLRGRYWNECYALRNFLSYNESWEIYLFNHYVGIAFREFLEDHFPLCLKNIGGSIYLRKNK